MYCINEMLKVYKLFLFHLIIFLRVCAQRKILPSCNHITAKCEKMYPDRTRQEDQIVDGERACSKYSGQQRLEKNTKHGHCNKASHRKNDSSFFKYHYNCKNHKYHMDRVKRIYFKRKKSTSTESSSFETLQKFKYLKSLKLKKYKNYLFNQQRFLRQEYKKEYKAAKKEYAINRFTTEKFPTTFHITDHSYRNDFLLKINLDYIEKMVNYAAATRDSSTLQVALEMYDRLPFMNKHTTRFLLQKGDALALSYTLDISNGSFNVFNRAISTYNKIFSMENVSNEQFEKAATNIVDLLHGRNMLVNAIPIQKLLHTRYPYSTEIIDRLGLMYIEIGDNVSARKMFETSLQLRPNNELALFIVGHMLHFNDTTFHYYRHDFNWSASHDGLNLMQRALHTKGVNVMHAINFKNCGYALTKAGRDLEANDIFRIAVENDLFPSFWQRSIHNIKGIKSKALWEIGETKIGKLLNDIKKKWKIIKREAMYAVASDFFSSEKENLHDIGKWSEYSIISGGRSVVEHCLITPVTCHLVTDIPHVNDCPTCDVKFSLMESGTHIIPHSGPNNHKLRLHLGLDVASVDLRNAGEYVSRMRVGNDYVAWKDGEFTIFDDSFDHEVWHFHPQNRSRLVLIIDILHPRLSECEIASL